MERGFSSFRSIPTWLTLIASFTVGSILGYFIIQRRNRIHQFTFAENSDNQPKIRKVDENTTIHSKSENKERENNQTGKEQRTEEKTEQSAVPPTIVERKEAVLEEGPMPPILKFKNNATEKALIIDYGTTTLRSGPVAYSPSYEAPNIVGHPKGRNSKKYWSEFRKGNEAFDNRKLGEGLQIVQPVHGGVIQDFDASEFIWNELLSNGLSYYDLEGFSDLSVLMTASPASRNRICEILFEEYSVGKLLLVSQDFLALADSQTWTGLSVHLGSENSSVVPIYNGCAIESARKQFSVCGKTLTEYVSERVAWDTQRHAIGRMDDFIKYKISNSLKCNFTCVPDEFGFFNDRKNEFLSTISNRANNPTENILDNQLLVGLVNDNVSKAGDALFYDENNSLQQVIFRALQSCDSALHERSLGNVVVHGGTAALPGLKSRLELELETIASRNNIHYPVNVMIQEKPHQAAWRGACNLSTLTSFPDMFITGELFHEEGHAVCRSYFMS